MATLAGELLTRYYGFGENSNRKTLSIHECMTSVENDQEKSELEQSSVETSEEKLKKTDTEDENTDDKSLGNDAIARSSRVLDADAFEEEDENSDDIYHLLACSKFPSNHHVEDNTNDTKASGVPGLEETTINELNLTITDEVLADSASDVSSSAAKKKYRKSSKSENTPLPPLPKKSAIYNETFVDLSNTEIASFPMEILKEYSRLQMLYLENNNLSALPDELFSALRELQWLDVRNNQLTIFPATVKSHPCLETVLLEGNKIEKLPLELCFLPKLKTLHINNNPLVFPPKDVLTLGCSGILSFLRSEWNKLHPEEPAEDFRDKEELDLRPSTILCYRSPRKKNQKTSKIIQSRSLNSVNEASEKSSVRQRSRSYKPSNRCKSKDVNVALQQRYLLMSKMKEMLSKQDSIIQKVKNENVIKDWRQDKRSFGKSMEKVSRRGEDDIPFAIDIKSYSASLKPKEDKLPMKTKRKSDVKLPADINKRINELLESLNQLRPTQSSEILSPKTQQKYLKEEIEKISRYREEIENLKRYNEVVTTPFQYPELLAKI